MSPSFRIELERDRFAPGDAVRGTILVLEGGSSRDLEVLLEYIEETDDRHEIKTVRRGRRVLVSVRELERWLERSATAVLE